MPRLYIPNPRARRYKPQNYENLEKAAKEVKNGLSLRKAAAKYDLHYSGLQRYMKANGKPKSIGGQLVLGEEVERMIVKRLITCISWGYSFNNLDLRMMVKDYLDKNDIVIQKFGSNNMPGVEFTHGFLKRHASEIDPRSYRNDRRSKVLISKERVNEYFNNLEVTLDGVPPSNIINYSEISLSDDIEMTKVIEKRIMKYPELVLKSTESFTSIMFTVTGDGQLLPCYVVFKALSLKDRWKIGAPNGTQFNNTASGWFNPTTFENWFYTIVIPYFKQIQGTKVLIGDSFSSYLSCDLIQICEEIGAKFVFLPPKTTHITQPLDVAIFKLLETAWNDILIKLKNKPRSNKATVSRENCPRLLRSFMKSLEPNQKEILKSGFKKCGIIPMDRSKILELLANDKNTSKTLNVVNSTKNILNESTFDTSLSKPIKKRKLTGDSSGDEDNDEKYKPSTSKDLVLFKNELPVSSRCKFVEPPKVYKNVLPIKEEDINIDKWLMVKLNLKLSICRVIKKTEQGFKGLFLRKKPSRESNYTLMVYPNEPDEHDFEFKHVVGFVKSPILMFEVIF